MKRKTGFCPIRRGQCLDNCMWRVDGVCAVALIGGQARRQGDELFAIAEIMMRGPDAIEGDAEQKEARQQ
mgnify:CR=1 FL=1